MYNFKEIDLELTEKSVKKHPTPVFTVTIN